MKMVPSKQHIRKSWDKYGLIVVGNIVFFMLLYFISYRPHNEENRASEFLSMAQQEETADNWQTAMVLYEKLSKDYPGTRSAETAKYRIEYLNNHPPVQIVPTPKMVAPVLDIEKMLDRKPSVYVAKFLAKHYNDTPKLKSKMKQTIGDYLKIAINYDGVLLKTLKSEKEFQTEEFQQAFFRVKPRCQMKSDWVYDDFFIKNTGIFPWHSVKIQMQIAQGGTKTRKDIRIPLLNPGRTVEVESFRIKKGGGDAVCSGMVKTREGTAKFKNRI